MKLKWKPKLYKITFDLEGYRKRLVRFLRDANVKAGRKWVRAAANDTPIPTWSGASRGTFLKLSYQLGLRLPIGQIMGPKKEVNIGVYSATASGIVEKLTKNELYVGFVYDTVLRHLVYNEYNSPVPGKYPKPYSNRVRFTPYGFQSRAYDAWQESASKFEFPSTTRYFKRKKI